jgi:hypothetical protein
MTLRIALLARVRALEERLVALEARLAAILDRLIGLDRRFRQKGKK